LLVIRLARTGKKKQAYFRIVVADKRRAVGAKFVEILGNYNPHEKKLELNQEKLNEYMKNGAQPSNTLAKILKKEGVKLPKWVYINERNRPAKKVVEEKPEPKKAEEATSDATEEVKSEEDTAVEEENPEAKEEKKEAPAEEKAEVVEESKEEVKDVKEAEKE